MNRGLQLIDAWLKRAQGSPFTVRLYAALSAIAIGAYGLSSGSPASLLGVLFQAGLVISVLLGSYSGWALAVALAAVGLVRGIQGAEGWMVLVPYTVLALALLLTRTARAWTSRGHHGDALT